jgi:hypothetical protein
MNITPICLLLLAALSACGGGLAPLDTPAENPPPGGASNGFFVFDYSDGSAPERDLLAVDPADASKTFVVAAAGQYRVLGAPIVTGTVDQSTKVVSELHNHAIVYVDRRTGTLAKASAAKPGAPTVVQLSSESGAGPICSESARFHVDYAAPDQTTVLYAFAGPDNNCATELDNRWRLVRLDMGASASPFEAKPPLLRVVNPTTGKPDGWLALDNNRVVKVDNEFVVVNTFAEGFQTTARALANDLILLDDVLFRVEGGPLELTRRHTLAADTTMGLFERDTDNVYFVEVPNAGAGALRRVLKLTVAGNDDPTELAVEESDVRSLALTDNRVVFLIRDGASDVLKSAAKTGGAAAQPIATEPSIAPVFGAGTKFYYQLAAASPPAQFAEPTAVVVGEDGLNRLSTVGARWVAVLPGVSRFNAVTGDGFSAIPKLIQVDGFDAGDHSGGSVRSFDAATGNPIAGLGTLPTGAFASFSAVVTNQGDATTIAAANRAGGLRDSFFIDANRADSLKRLTNTIQ